MLDELQHMLEITRTYLEMDLEVCGQAVRCNRARVDADQYLQPGTAQTRFKCHDNLERRQSEAAKLFLQRGRRGQAGLQIE